jgi:hypothetical protein
MAEVINEVVQAYALWVGKRANQTSPQRVKALLVWPEAHDHSCLRPRSTLSYHSTINPTSFILCRTTSYARVARSQGSNEKRLFI